MKISVLALTLFILGASILVADEPSTTEKTEAVTTAKTEKKEPPPPVDHQSITTHSATIGGQTIRYTATAGNLVMKEEDGTPLANVFYVAYTRDGAGEVGRRPITFAFNGGPGSSSVWLHMGAFGPKRVDYADAEGHAATPPYHLVDNESSILDLTDLVFIDPVTTGFSRAVPPKEDVKFHGLQADTRSVGDFIRLYLARSGRWSSPKFLAGESYGTTRAAALSGYLLDNGVYLNGIVLISTILNFQTVDFTSGNDLPYVLYLPTYTATAWYHHKLPPALQEGSLSAAVDTSRRFALGPYSEALMKGDSLPAAERKEIVAQLAQLTGLDPAFVDRTNLRIRDDRFFKELLRGQRRTVGRLDSRFLGIDSDSAGESAEYDPSYAAIMGPYTATVNDYVRRELKYESDLPYEILTGRVYPWTFENSNNRYADVGDTLRKAMTQNPAMRLFVAAGYYDLATPFEAAVYTFDRLGLDPEIKPHITIDFFEAGHMMYIHRPSHTKLKEDLVSFYHGALP
jgi:carboxypeptidase C (cathepsin A)